MLTLTTLQKSPARFDMCGKFLGYDLKEVESDIKPGLARRLVKHALDRLSACGFTIPTTWKIEVETTDDHDRPSDRTYHVAFYNEEGGSMGVQGIQISRHGWPVLDYGLFIHD